ncbi:MAG: hypothetical protein U0S50_07835 [Sphingopyxis sp.]|uniref:hypothetical protein n=1 Tax=Sphingopyxis sp. TaxID=1908224 RepID=UPI002AB912CE|nr:hypothetical protein [Sphingopyxis sp.]MDZ3831711.1 hypothetical protein [Sphingopyxis sp.]
MKSTLSLAIAALFATAAPAYALAAHAFEPAEPMEAAAMVAGVAAADAPGDSTAAADAYGEDGGPRAHEQADAIPFICPNKNAVDGMHRLWISRQNPDHAEFEMQKMMGDLGAVAEYITMTRVAQRGTTARYESDDMSFDVTGDKGVFNFMGFTFDCARQPAS